VYGDEGILTKNATPYAALHWNDGAKDIKGVVDASELSLG